MGTGKVIVISIITSIIVASGTFFGLRTLVGASSAEHGVVVPPLEGLRTDQARKLLEVKGLLLIVTEQRDDPKVAEGRIVTQVPLEGSKVKDGAEIKVVVSKGSNQLQVPTLQNLTLSAATQALTVVGFSAGAVTRQNHEKVDKDLVISSSPEAGHMAAKGTTIALVLSDGSAGVEVPKVLYMGHYKAKKTLEDLGFKVRVRYTEDEDRRGGVVLRQEPKEGEKAPKGSEVQLTVNEDD